MKEELVLPAPNADLDLTGRDPIPMQLDLQPPLRHQRQLRKEVDGWANGPASGQQVQQSIRFLFQSFRRLSSACAVVRAFREAKLLFPRRLRGGPQQGELLWQALDFNETLFVLHNPRYAGAFAYGQTRRHKTLDGVHQRKMPQEEWHTLLTGAHPGYITWEEYQENQRRLRENAHALGPERREGPPREGPALLQGLAVCGVCRGRMNVAYHVRAFRPGRSVPQYFCQGRSMDRPQPVCQWVPGIPVDQAVGDLLLKIMTPVTVDITAGGSARIAGPPGRDRPAETAGGTRSL